MGLWRKNLSAESKSGSGTLWAMQLGAVSTQTLPLNQTVPTWNMQKPWDTSQSPSSSLILCARQRLWPSSEVQSTVISLRKHDPKVLTL